MIIKKKHILVDVAYQQGALFVIFKNFTLPLNENYDHHNNNLSGCSIKNVCMHKYYIEIFHDVT